MLLRLTNLPWNLTRLELANHVGKYLDTKVRYTKILYDRDTGLSRGIGFIQLYSEQLMKDVARRGNINIDGRIVAVGRENKS